MGVLNEYVVSSLPRRWNTSFHNVGLAEEDEEDELDPAPVNNGRFAWADVGG